MSTTTTGATTLRYLPFGNPWTQQFFGGLTALPTDKLFTGHERKGQVSGLYYAGARFYSADLGRFLSADILVGGPGNPRALNRFAYVQNNPLTYTDPTGYWCPGCNELRQAITATRAAIRTGGQSVRAGARWTARAAWSGARFAGTQTERLARASVQYVITPGQRALFSGISMAANTAVTTAVSTGEFAADYASDKTQDVAIYVALNAAAPQSVHQNSLALGISLLSLGDRRQGAAGFALYEDWTGVCQLMSPFLDGGGAFAPGYLAFGPNGAVSDSTFRHENQHHIQSLILGPAYLPTTFGFYAAEGHDDSPLENDADRARREGIHIPFVP